MDKNDENWQDTCLRVIEFFSQLWGGAYNLIVPTDEKLIDERFWTILEAFDPDNLYAYRKSGEDIRLSEPAQFRELLDSRVSSWIAQFGDHGLEQVKKDIEHYLKLESSENFSFVTDREFWKPEGKKADAEIDLFCVSDGVLTIGEAKKEDRLGESTSEENAEIAKYKRVAAGLSVRRVILATYSESWNARTVERITSAFSDTPRHRSAPHCHASSCELTIT